MDNHLLPQNTLDAVISAYETGRKQLWLSSTEERARSIAFEAYLNRGNVLEDSLQREIDARMDMISSTDEDHAAFRQKDYLMRHPAFRIEFSKYLPVRESKIPAESLVVYGYSSL